MDEQPPASAICYVVLGNYFFNHTDTYMSAWTVTPVAVTTRPLTLDELERLDPKNLDTDLVQFYAVCETGKFFDHCYHVDYVGEGFEFTKQCFGVSGYYYDFIFDESIPTEMVSRINAQITKLEICGERTR